MFRNLEMKTILSSLAVFPIPEISQHQGLPKEVLNVGNNLPLVCLLTLPLFHFSWPSFICAIIHYNCSRGIFIVN